MINAATEKDYLRIAADEFIARRKREKSPDGKFDNAKRWYPSDQERRDCCNVRSPSRSYPYSILKHCCTIKHIANLFNVDEKYLRKMIAQLDELKRIETKISALKEQIIKCETITEHPDVRDIEL